MRISAGVIALVSLAGAAGVLAAPGADIITGDVTGVSRYGMTGVAPDQVTGYAVGTTSCNVGTPGSTPEPWVSGSNQHPLVGQNMYRLKVVDGSARFEQIGMSWLKHTFATINNGICGTCSGPTGSQLAVGCSDPYWSTLNGDQTDLGPRSEVNAFTGAYPYPYQNSWQAVGNASYKRFSMFNRDLDPAQNAGARYFGEGHYISNNEATLGNGNNNSSHREMTVGALTGTGYDLQFTSTTQRERPAITAWKDIDPGVTLQQVNIPGEGRLYVAGQATSLGGGMWHYEYAIYNHNSHRSVGSFSVPVGAGVTVSNIGFKDINYHSGEPYSNIDWPGVRGASDVSWATDPYDASFVAPAGIPARQGGNANALRWGTLYNFRFDANAGPSVGGVNLGLWRPGTPDGVSAAMPIPSVPPPPSCPGDANGDLVVDAADLSVLLSGFGGHASGPGEGDFNADGRCDGADLSVLLGQFGTTC